jgi:hypothetical protein
MPTEVLYGPRLGKQGQLRTGCSAVLFDHTREKVLLRLVKALPRRVKGKFGRRQA